MDEKVEQAIRGSISGDREHHRYLGVLDAIEALQHNLPDEDVDVEIQGHYVAGHVHGLQTDIAILQKLAAQKLEANLKDAYEERERRVAQNASILEKHADPNMQVDG